MVITKTGPDNWSRRKRQRKVTVAESAKKANADKNIEKEPFLICDDCKHNTITYEPSKEGACSCGCH
jgi:TPP-dependent indolepyruvate ferredoxin oxidoreductase alpha subunit